MCALRIGELEVEIGANTSGLKKAEGEVKKTGKSMERTFSRVGGAISAALSVEAARQVVMIADRMTRLEGTVKRLTRTTGDFNKVWSELARVSDENGIAIADSTALFQRFQSSLKGITDQNEDVIAFIDNLQKLGRIGGSSAQELSNALTQLSQGLSGGVIRAEEFNSIMEGAPEILKAAAANIDGIDGNLGKLRKAMLDGELTSETLFKALQKGAADTEREFAELPRTIDMASAALANNFAAAVSTLDKQIGASENIAKFIDFLAQGAGDLAGVDQIREIDRAIAGAEARIESFNRKLETSKKFEGKGLVDQFVELLSGEDISVGTDELNAALQKDLELLNQLKKERDELVNGGGGKGKTTETTSKLVFQQEGFGELSDADAKALQEFNKLQAERERSTQESLDSIFMMNRTEKEKLLTLETEQLSKIDDLMLEGLIDFEKAEAAKIEIGKSFAQQRMDLEKEVVEKTVAAYDQLSKSIGDQLGSALAGTQKWADAMKNIIGDLASQFITAGITSAFGGAVGGDNMFGSLFSGGGRAMGGPTSGSLVHPINERGTPEILNQAGKQFLLPTGKGGTITPLSQGGGNGTPNISMINMGTPQEVQGVQITESGIEIMIADKLKQYDKALNAELGKANSKKLQSLRKAAKFETNVGR